jgi:hypothetical protein
MEQGETSMKQIRVYGNHKWCQGDMYVGILFKFKKDNLKFQKIMKKS